jgi:hypothetical protein
MKGQYRLIFEVMLILVGILITSFVVSSFKTVEQSVTTVSVEDNFNAIANNIIIGLLKVSQNKNSVVQIMIPEKISDHVYKIKLENNELSILSLKDSKVNITRQIFNINQTNMISRVINSEIVSSAQIVEIINENNNNIKIRRLPPNIRGAIYG